MQVIWSAPPGTNAFTAIYRSRFTIDLTSPELATAVIRIGQESIRLKSLPASPRVVPTSLAVTQSFAPRYSWGNPLYLDRHGDRHHRDHGTQHLGQLRCLRRAGRRSLNAENPAMQLVARGIYDRATNTFTATSIDFVL